MSTQLISLEGVTAAVLFDPKSGTMDNLLQHLEEEALAEVMDGSTVDGRKRCTQHKNQVVQVQKAFDALKKSESKELKDRTKVIDSEGKRAHNLCEELKTKIMAPRVEWEANEAERKEGHLRVIDYIKDLNTPPASNLTEKEKLTFYEEKLTCLRAVAVDDSLEEFEVLAQQQLNATLGHLESCYVSTKDQIAKDEELEAFRADKAKREQADKDEALRLEGEKRAEEKLKADQEKKLKDADDAREAAIKEANDRLEQPNQIVTEGEHAPMTVSIGDAEPAPTYDDGTTESLSAISGRSGPAPIETTFAAPPIPDLTDRLTTKASVNNTVANEIARITKCDPLLARECVVAIFNEVIPHLTINYDQ